MKHLIIITCFFFSGIVFAQKTPNFTTFINECVIKGIKGDAYLDTKVNTAHVFAIAFSFDSKGRIDTIYYSDQVNTATKNLFALDSSLLKRIKAFDFKFNVYANQIVLVPFFWYRITDKLIDYKSGFLNDLNSILPEAIKDKPVIILSPVIDASLPKQH